MTGLIPMCSSTQSSNIIKVVETIEANAIHGGKGIHFSFEFSHAIEIIEVVGITDVTVSIR